MFQSGDRMAEKAVMQKNKLKLYFHLLIVRVQSTQMGVNMRCPSCGSDHCHIIEEFESNQKGFGFFKG